MPCCAGCEVGGPCDGQATFPRYAQTIVGYDAQFPLPTVYGPGTAWSKQLGELGAPTVADCLGQGLCLDLPTGTCKPCIIPGTLPGLPQPQPGQPPPTIPLLTEQQCQQREAAAFTKGRTEESSKVWKTAAISAAVSVVVGAAVGYGLRKVARR